MRFTRIAGLGWRQLVLNRLRWAMLTCTTVTALSVFLVTHALSNASAGELDDAVQATLGHEGTYTIDVPNNLAAPILDTVGILGGIVREHRPIATVTFVELHSAVERCPGRIAPQSEEAGASTTTGEIPRLVVVLDAAGTSTLDGGRRVPRASGDWCLDGVRVDAIDANGLEQLISGALGDVTAPLLVGRDQIQVATAGARAVRSVMNFSVFPSDAHPADRLRDALGRALGPAATRAGQPRGWTDTIDVRRTDRGEDLRAAGEGVRLVYGLIGAAVLGVGATALLVAQVMTSQARAWFYALTVAWGARRRDIVALAATEVCAVVAVSMSATVAIAAAADGPISRWTDDRFGQAMHVFDPSLLARLVVAAGAVILAATVPAAIAVSRADPLEVLE